MTNDLVDYDKALRQLALEAARAESGDRRKFISTDGGDFSQDGEPFPSKSILCIILASINTNIYYEGVYQGGGKPKSASCYAIGTTLKDMRPHQDIIDAGTAQCESCIACEKNKYESDPIPGRKGKACKNKKRIALIQVGVCDPFSKRLEIFKDADVYKDSPIEYLSIPVTSTLAFSKYISKLALANPPTPSFCVVTKISIVKDTKAKYKLEFENVENVDKDMVQILYARYSEAKADIGFALRARNSDEEETEAF